MDQFSNPWDDFPASPPLPEHDASLPPIDDRAYELLTAELVSAVLTTDGTVATFAPREGDANEEYCRGLQCRLDSVFGESRVSVGKAIGARKVEVRIPRQSRVRVYLDKAMRRDDPISL